MSTLTAPSLENRVVDKLNRSKEMAKHLTQKVYFPWFIKDQILPHSPTPASHILDCVNQGRLDIVTARAALYQLYGDSVTLEQQAEIEAKTQTITPFVVI